MPLLSRLGLGSHIPQDTSAVAEVPWLRVDVVWPRTRTAHWYLAAPVL